MRWGVVSTISEPAPLVYAFVAHYAELGASRIDIYLDTPDQEIADRLERVRGCRVIQKTVGDWTRVGNFGPPSPPRRQAINAQESYAVSDVDWILHVDADEFLIEDENVLSHLDLLPPDTLYLGLDPLERVLVKGEPNEGIFDGVFRRLAPETDQATIESIYGPQTRFLDSGFSSNGQAKCFCRTGRDLVMGVHGPLLGDDRTVSGEIFPSPVLLHFDGLTEAHFLAKLDRKIAQNAGWRNFPAPGRRQQLLSLKAAGNSTAARSALFSNMKMLTPDQAEHLNKHGLLERHDFDPLPSIRRVFPDLIVDLGCAHFDDYSLDEMKLPWIWRVCNELKGRSFTIRQRLWPRRRLRSH